MCVIKGSLEPRERPPRVVWGRGAAGAPQLLRAYAAGSCWDWEKGRGSSRAPGHGGLGLGWGEEREGRGPGKESGPRVRALLFLREMETEGAPPHTQGGAGRRWEAGRGWRRGSREATRPPPPQICASSRGRGPPQVPPVQPGAPARKRGLGSGLPAAGVPSSPTTSSAGGQDPLSEGAPKCPSLPTGAES